ncbi:hypothetical protein AKJ63_00925 [candidate division MSBL1 archaeon SCGC-AAA259D18]|uniref:Uncharacterized protein n=1 Tax=candidate division MSBL1 archaeon SCGC-AAA259D18 TaxID=1698262 RepID=A0A133UC98_9EURY|nr:hypothetical protein AKJ63_00925 [candidate division MSBL1 archaeon SCGC-AAA259D18]
MRKDVNLNRGAKIKFAPCSNPREDRNVVMESGGVKILRCRQHGGYFISVFGSSGGHHYRTIQGAIQVWKSCLKDYSRP